MIWLTFRVPSFSAAYLSLTRDFISETTEEIGLLCLKKYFLKSIHHSNTKFCGRVENWMKFVLTVLVCMSVLCQLVICSVIPVFTCSNTP